MRAWEIISGGGVDTLNLADRATPDPGPGQVRVRMNANSINYRDLTTIEDPISRKLPFPTVPNSDGAGVVTAAGAGVSLREGDRVTSCFFEDWTAGEISAAAMASALGGARQGVLAEEVILPERGVIATPDHLTDAEAATLPCAALTAWHALTLPRPITAGETVLLLGTGGVSVFAQQFCTMMGARTIVTSSSDAKLAKMVELGANRTINYRTNPDWDAAVLDLTGGVGVDRVVEVGGPGTFDRSVNAVRVGGIIGLIGILTGIAGQASPTAIMRKSLTIRGIYVGPRAMFADMNRAITAHGLRPVIDQSFAFDDAKDAYHTMRGAGHFGKLVINI
ncbi:MAG: NAD(P)-dependent alcohol dehydrogenase [Minwuia sp.]|nr:NAD(P)-dependent alcohol dehydrogenase [Minwuia sp.]